MRVAVYNQMFGLDGRSFWGNLLGHWAVHYQKNPLKIWKRANLSETFKVVKKIDADVQGVIEVLEGQEKEIIRGLKKLGYRYFYFGKGHKTKYSHLHVMGLVASKIRGVEKRYKEWPLEDELGGGGGMIVVNFPKLKLNLVNIHLATPEKNLFFEQIKHTQKVLRKLTGKVVLMGDFNESFKNVEEHFSDLDLVSGRTKTCSFTPIMKRFCYKDMDHILVRGLKKKDLGFVKGRSDHLAVWADLE